MNNISIVKPYILKKANNLEEFLNIQVEMFENGYQWFNGQGIYTPPSTFKFPLYISNLPFKDERITIKFENIRKSYGLYDNNILFFGYDYDFDVNKLRLLKITHINNL
jgi:hypothetical protein